MADLQQYQKYRLKRESSGSKIFKFVLWIILILIAIWIFKGCFGKKETTSPNTNANVNVNVNANSNLDISANANANTNVSVAPSTSFNLDNCRAAFSRGQNRKQVTLTFNGASKTDNLAQISDILKTSSVPASFFMTGELISENKEAVKSLSDQGFSIYNLSYDYSHIVSLSAEDLTSQLKRTDDACISATGKSSKPFFRPPYGEISDSIFTTVKNDGYCPVLWTVDAYDWDTSQTADGAKTRVLDNLKDGTIVVMQAGTKLVPQFLPDLINEIKNRGYSFVDLPTILTP
ncbi:MAG: polysaccharide deacetylase family protein [Patescibacteria group bacterium]